MPPIYLLLLVSGYFLLLLGVAWKTSRCVDNDSYFIGNKSSNWMLVAFGMVGTSVSCLTFISVPGAVGRDGFGYLQILIGAMAGYLVIACVLLPLYYRLGLTSIYAYLGVRLGRRAYQSGAAFFILSRTLGAAARLYLVVNILQVTLLDSLQVPFWLTSTAILSMILLYTYEGGVKTIVWTDTLQTFCMLVGLAVCIFFLLDQLQLSPLASLARMRDSGLSRVVTSAVDSPGYFWKQVLAGACITIAMTGMDQEMMQKTISVKTLADAQKNILSLALILVVVISSLLFLGGLLYLYAPLAGVSAKGDAIFAAVVLAKMPAAVQLVFFVALISALFPSADGAITALTSSFCIDILGMNRRADLDEKSRTRRRRHVHLGFTALFLALVMAFRWIGSPSMIGTILKLAGYTYGPLLGLFAFGILTRRAVADRWVPLAVMAGPLLCAAVDGHQAQLFGSYRVGLELLIVNGLLVFVCLLLISRPASARSEPAAIQAA